MRLVMGFVLSAFVPISGLVSCTNDAEAPQVRHVSDSWRLPTPTLRILRAGKETDLDVTDKRIKEPLPSDAMLVFPVDQLESLRDVKIAAHSTCFIDQKTLNTYATFDSPATIHLADIFPAEQLVGYSAGSIEKLVCNYEFEAKNGNQSPHKFVLEDLKFTDFSPHQSLQIVVPSRPTFVWSHELWSPKIDDFKLAFADGAAPETSDLYMTCASFYNFRKGVSKAQMPSVLKELVLGEQRSFSNELAIASHDSRTKDPTQACHFSAVHSNAAGHQQLSFSTFAIVHFPLKAPVVTWNYGDENYDANNFNNTTFMRIQIENVSAEQLSFDLTNLDGAPSMQVQPVINRNGTLFVSNTLGIQLVTTIETQQKAISFGGRHKLYVAPGEIATITLRMVGPNNCLVMNKRPWQGEYYAGLAYALIRPLTLTAVNDLQDSSETQDLTLWPNPTGTVGSGLPGWIPHLNWMQQNGAQPRGLLFPATDNLCQPYVDPNAGMPG